MHIIEVMYASVHFVSTFFELLAYTLSYFKACVGAARLSTWRTCSGSQSNSLHQLTWPLSTKFNKEQEQNQNRQGRTLHLSKIMPAACLLCVVCPQNTTTSCISLPIRRTNPAYGSHFGKDRSIFDIALGISIIFLKNPDLEGKYSRVGQVWRSIGSFFKSSE